MQINIAQYILETVRSAPDKLAVKDSEKSLDFVSLFRWGVKVSDDLWATGITKNIPVVILVPKSSAAVVGIIATTFSGAVYVPVDSSSPLERLRVVYDQLGEARILCCESTFDKARLLESDSKKIVCLSSTWTSEEKCENVSDLLIRIDQRMVDVIDQDPCYVIFTSGSTGTPKGVTIAHRSVIDYIEWARSVYPINREDRIASQAPFYFDNSTLDLYLSFSTGASLHLPPDRTYVFPKLILDYLADEKITTIFWVPSVLVSVANSGLLEKNTPRSLKNVLFAGEQMPVPQINSWIKVLPGTLFSNLYGPTEITVDCTAYTFFEPFEGDILPIGYACRNTDVLVLNEAGKECGENEIGELHVRGTSLALGYWNDANRTDQAFIQNPLEKRFRDLVYRTGDLVKRDSVGCITFIGRRDSQIKLNGYRIELGEIEAAAAKISGVGRNAVLLDARRRVLVLFVEMLPGISADMASMRRELAHLLPKYMIPAEITVVSNFDLNQNGKIDRLKLAKKIEEKV